MTNKNISYFSFYKNISYFSFFWRKFSYILVKNTKLNKKYFVKFGLNEEEILKIRTVPV